jgi:hypothetical protein
MNVVPPPHVPLSSWLAHPSNQHILDSMPHLKSMVQQMEIDEED